MFFGTHARLVSQDTDESGDLYDARIGGGFPVAGGRGPCEGNACENPAAAPIASTPATLTLAGSGNIAPEASPPPAPKKTTKKTVRCAKGKKLNHGTCVKKKKSKQAKRAKRAGNERRADR